MGRGRRRASAKGIALVDTTEPKPYGALAPGWLDRAVIAVTSRLPANWLGLRLAILLRRLVTMRLAGRRALDVERWGLRLRLHPLDNGCEKGLLFTPQMFEPEERAELARDDRPQAARRALRVRRRRAAMSGCFRCSWRPRARAARASWRSSRSPATSPGWPSTSRPIQACRSSRRNWRCRTQPGELAIELDRRDRGGTRAHRLDARRDRRDGAGAVPDAAGGAPRRGHRSHRRAQDRRRGHGGRRSSCRSSATRRRRCGPA